MRVETKFVPNQWVSVDKPPLIVKAKTADQIAKASDKNLYPQTVKPLTIIKMQPHTIVLDKERVPDTVSMHRVTAAPWLKKHPVTAQTPVLLENENRTTYGKRKKKTSERDRKNSTSLSEYAADHIIDHKDRGQNWKYIVRWYGYRPDDDTLEPEPAGSIPKHFITRYHRLVNRKQSNA